LTDATGSADEPGRGEHRPGQGEHRPGQGEDQPRDTGRTRIVQLSAIQEVTDALRADQLAAVPTETVYGLAARAESPEAVASVFRVKERPADNPLIVHCADAAQAFSLTSDTPAWARTLGEALWPGPLTLVLHSAVDWPWVQAGHATLAVRVPAPEHLREIIRKVGPLAAPSANRSGRPSPTTAAHVLADLDGRIPVILDGGPCTEGLESTVIDCTGTAPVILRPGPVTEAQVTAILADTTAGHAGRGAVGVSPGTRHPHYRPLARVTLGATLGEVSIPEGAMVIAPAWEEPAAPLPDSVHFRRWTSVEEVARELYAWLREADALGLSHVVVVPPPEKGLGVAVMNRLRKASAD
jgi:L-threonylcarbamoyladenylate synthase